MASPGRPPKSPSRAMSSDEGFVQGVSVPLSRSPRLLRKMTSTAGGRFSETVDIDATSCTTVAIGKDTYTIVSSRKPSQKKMVLNNSEVAEGNETIRIFRRTRSGRPTTRDEIDFNGDDNTLQISAGSLRSGLRAKSEDVPPPEAPGAVKEAGAKLKQIIGSLRETFDSCGTLTSSTFDFDGLFDNLEYISDVVQCVASKAEPEDELEGSERDEHEPEDDLSELQSEAVPEEVRKWLASTFAKQETAPRRSAERPSFRSVANAIRTGIFIERIYRRMSSSQLMTIPPEVQHVLKHVDHWNFDTFSLNRVSKGAPLRYIGYELLTRHGCLHKYKIPPSKLETMLSHLEQGYSYNGNPYHNNLHACDVLQTTHYFISQTGLANWISDLEIFTSLIAAMIHDYDHTGTTNNFHINSVSNLALLYNDRAVLENHHVSAFFRMIQEHDCNIFSNMQKTDFREFRSLCIEMVLHTDMSQHFSQLKAMKSILQQHAGEPSVAAKQWKKIKHGRLIATPIERCVEKPKPISFDKTKVLSLILHSCDVSHPAKRWDLHHQWTSRCMEEFFVQGDREADMGLEYSPLCDRHNTMVPQSQIGFIDFIVSPTLTVLGDVMDSIFSSLDIPASRNNPKSIPENSTQEVSYRRNTMVRPWLDTLIENKSKWQSKHDAGEQGIEPISNNSRVSSAVSDEKPGEAAEEKQTEVILSEAKSILRDPSSQFKNSEANTESPVKGKLQRQTIQFDSEPPEKDTKLEDIVGDLPSNVLSRPGTPDVWNFDEKEISLKVAPPRPTSATLCSPPVPRKVPISVDHKLRK